MDLVLVNVRADGRQLDVPVKRAHTVIGRRDDCQVRISLANVSRQHCEIVEENGSFTLRDLGSSNGTFVNGQRAQEATLSPGDVLTVGDAVFVVRLGGEPTHIDASAAFNRGKPSTPPPGTPSAIATREDEVLGGLLDADESSVDFDFDELADDQDDQPAL